MKESADLKKVVSTLRADSADLTDEVVNLTQISSGTNQSIKNLLSVFTRNATTTQVASKKTEKKSEKASLRTERQTAEVSQQAQEVTEESSGKLLGSFQGLNQEFQIGNKLSEAGGAISRALLRNSTLTLLNTIRTFVKESRERLTKLKEDRENQKRTVGFFERLLVASGVEVDRLDRLQELFGKGIIQRSEAKFERRNLQETIEESNDDLRESIEKSNEIAMDARENHRKVREEISALRAEQAKANGFQINAIGEQIKLKKSEMAEEKKRFRAARIARKEAAQEARKPAAAAKLPQSVKKEEGGLFKMIFNLIKARILLRLGAIFGGGGAGLGPFSALARLITGGGKGGGLLKNVTGFLTKFGTLFRVAFRFVGKVLGPIYLIIEGVIALFTGFQEAFQGEGNFMEKLIKGLFFSVRNFVANIVGGFVDSIKSIFVFLAEIFGGNSEDGWLKAVKDFSFTDLIKDFYNVIAEPFLFAKDLFSKGLVGASKAAKDRMAKQAEEGNPIAGFASDVITAGEEKSRLMGQGFGRKMIAAKAKGEMMGSEVNRLSRAVSGGITVNVQNNSGGNVNNSLSTNQVTSMPAASPIVTGSAAGAY